MTANTIIPDETTSIGRLAFVSGLLIVNPYKPSVPMKATIKFAIDIFGMVMVGMKI